MSNWLQRLQSRIPRVRRVICLIRPSDGMPFRVKQNGHSHTPQKRNTCRVGRVHLLIAIQRRHSGYAEALANSLGDKAQGKGVANAGRPLVDRVERDRRSQDGIRRRQHIRFARKLISRTDGMTRGSSKVPEVLVDPSGSGRRQDQTRIPTSPLSCRDQPPDVQNRRRRAPHQVEHRPTLFIAHRTSPTTRRPPPATQLGVNTIGRLQGVKSQGSGQARQFPGHRAPLGPGDEGMHKFPHSRIEPEMLWRCALCLTERMQCLTIPPPAGKSAS